ncbi:MAG: signal recognition particle-docking protein FtsY [Ignavibacteria bacterium]|jgi:fused signal recognition particle receptor|nr:signal recognition particle-docking protein FtsY [Ignavibacteria bacterium]MCU7501537.1 signal recognition particle-docking protein FtsY [Ignavibacteria bacterium]MCU7515947.1 signal recognition particle-docking protein FtsY [Ignavibacteria bacterium]
MNLFKNINFDKLKDGLSKTRDKIVTKINETITGKAKLDEELLEEIEEILITSDIGFDVASKVIENTRVRLRVEKDRSKLNVIDAIKEELEKLLNSYDTNSEFNRMDKFKPYVILVIGVNGAGKTTTIGKLAHNYKQAGLNVIIGSADTFRAAANEQLEVWAKRAGVEIIQSTTGSDPSAVAFDTMNIAKKKNADVVLIDTAGRLHTKSNLMEELKKIKKVMSKVVDYAPNETFLVLDGNTGQNALIQAEKFREVTDITGLIITKLDGTAKGGVVFQICSQQKVPVKYIGVGEGIDDLQTFDAQSFVSALFSSDGVQQQG